MWCLVLIATVVLFVLHLTKDKLYVKRAHTHAQPQTRARTHACSLNCDALGLTGSDINSNPLFFLLMAGGPGTVCNELAGVQALCPPTRRAGSLRGLIIAANAHQTNACQLKAEGFGGGGGVGVFLTICRVAKQERYLTSLMPL